MYQQYSNPELGARFIVSPHFPQKEDGNAEYLKFIWNDGAESTTLQIDDRQITLEPSSITCTTYLHKVHIDKSENNLKTLLFNREFYCVHTYDSEVSCNGLLFFGSNTSPILKLDLDEQQRLRTLFNVLNEEFTVRDSNQEEMLRILLKRFIIRCTRLAKEQILKTHDKQSDIDLIRQFNVLVEEHFKTIKSVSEYAGLLYKSPKTITNVFSKYSNESPLQVIHNRVIMEAKRMLYYTDKAAKEIGYELGYNDPAQFSKLFKNLTGMTTTDFKNSRDKLPSGQN
jgi:AraC-like DNA-binding protein